jgi:hypothetical protein
MDWKTILILSAVFAGLAILWPRIEPRARTMFLVVLYIPSLLLIVRWTMYRDAWGKLFIALGIGALGFIFWWALYGRKLPPPTSENITVLTDSKDE